MGVERLAESEYQSEYHATMRGPKPPFCAGLRNRIGVQIPVDFSLEKPCKCETFCV